MHDVPIKPPIEYGSLPPELQKEVEPICKGKTVEEISQIGEYFCSKASKMRQKLSENVTMEDYEKVMKRNGEEKEDAY